MFVTIGAGELNRSPCVRDTAAGGESNVCEVSISVVIEAPHCAIGKDDVLEHRVCPLDFRDRRDGEIGGDLKVSVTKFHCHS